MVLPRGSRRIPDEWNIYPAESDSQDVGVTPCLCWDTTLGSCMRSSDERFRCSGMGDGELRRPGFGSSGRCFIAMGILHMEASGFEINNIREVEFTCIFRQQRQNGSNTLEKYHWLKFRTEEAQIKFYR